MEKELSNYIKYCLGYIKLTRERTVAAQQKDSANLPKKHFGLEGLLNGDTDGNLGELVNLETFYSYDPKKVPEEKQDEYEKEKELANKLDNIYQKYQNDPFTKQIIFSFGYFEIELPIEIESPEDEAVLLRHAQGDINEAEAKELITFLDTNYVGKPVKVGDESGKIIGRSFGKIKVEFENGTAKAIEKSAVTASKATVENVREYLKNLALEKLREREEDEEEDEIKVKKGKIDRYPLFTLPVRIEKEINKAGVGKYSVYSVDPEVQINIGMLETILGEGLYFQLLKEVGEYEIEGKLALPLSDLEVFKEIWHKIKAQLRLTKVNFEEESFSLDEVKIALSPRVNYFLAEDLAKLAQLPEDQLGDTALTSWTVDDELTLEGDTPQETELYFPFLYDKYQLSTLSLLGNKASIIQGPPGTGKSETIANILAHLAATGKRVLFVSQKAQALKVVKDKLKKLDVKYLFGYIPNPNSAQIGEEDEIDGIAPQLSAIGSHIQKLDHSGGMTFLPLIPVVKEKIDLQEKISASIEKQRRYYQLHQELVSLKKYDISVSDFRFFADKFSTTDWQTIKNLKKAIEQAKDELKKYEKENPENNSQVSFEDLKPFKDEGLTKFLLGIKDKFLELEDHITGIQDEIRQLNKNIEIYSASKEKNDFDQRFIILEASKNDYNELLMVLRKDIEETAYDRHSKLFRKINNVSRSLRLKETLKQLPREIVDYVTDFLAKDTSRIDAKKFVASLCAYFEHYKNIRILEEKKTELTTLLNVFCKESAKGLPPEIIEMMRGCICHLDVSMLETKNFFSILIRYFGYHEKLNDLIVTKEELEVKCEAGLISCGLSYSDFFVLDQIIEDDTVSAEQTKWSILRVEEIKKELTELAKAENINTLSTKLKHSETDRSKRIAGYLQNIVNQNILTKWKTGITIKQIVQKLSKAFGKSKKAFKTFDSIRKDADNFKAMLDLIPIWIMELDDASRIIPLMPGLFDYVILDEASQCNVAYTLPVMFRSKRALFVGDSEQMRDSTIMFKSNKHFESLARMYQVPVERQIKAFGDTVQSVLNIAENRGFMAKNLHYHYRSPKELIGFSNEYFYKPNGKDLIPLNSNYLAYGDTNRVMLVHEVESDWSEEFSDKVNVAEAKAILELFKELREDDKYTGKSIGILTFFNHQATFLRELFEKEGFKEERDNYKISIIEGIQGDEKDIIIYSLVIRSPEQKNKYTSLTGEGGDIQAAVNRGRVNVAFSRAKLQVHCFVSMPPQEMPDKIWLKKYLEYIKENGEVAFYSTELKPFDSYFEEEFYNLMRSGLKTGYTIQNQVASCGFKIDFVISNANTGKKIAVECDGPTHFKDEIDEAYGIHIQSDEERQRVLEAAGWKFYRLKYMDWIAEGFDRGSVIEAVKETLI
jgi:very-short-patch-repair endonuclease